MKDKFIKYFSQISPLSPKEEAAIADSMVTVHFRKGDHLLKVGQRSMNMYFVPEGCIQEYVITDGEDKTT